MVERHEFEALVDFTSEIADAVGDLCSAIEDHMPPDAQQEIRKAVQRLRQASRTYFPFVELPT